MAVISPSYKYDDLRAVGPAFGAAVQTGPDYPDVQSPLNQVAVNMKMDVLDTPISPGLAGPLTGLDIDEEAPLGGSNQSFAVLSQTREAIENITRSVKSLQAPRLSEVASARYFQDTLTRTFNPAAPTGVKTRTAEEILASAADGCVADLSTHLAMASGGVTTSKQLIEGINRGLNGYTTVSSQAEMQRLGPNGMSRERLLK